MEECLWGGLLVLTIVTLYWNILKSFCMFKVYNSTSSFQIITGEIENVINLLEGKNGGGWEATITE